MQPNGNRFPFSEDALSEPRFPLVMEVCPECWQVQIREFPSPEFLFTDHPYLSGLNAPIREHFAWLAGHLIDKLSLPERAFVLDIGCNDGTLLAAFARHGMRTLGVDPGQQPAARARAAGLLVADSFWGAATGRYLRQVGLHPNLITATAVFYHVADLHGFVDGVAQALANDGIFVVQAVWLKTVIEQLQFDHIYHEHSCLHAVGPLQRLFAEHGLTLFDVEFVDVHGGSLLLYVARSGTQAVRPTVQAFIDDERNAGLYERATYDAFAERVAEKGRDLRALLVKLAREGKTVAGLGAPVKGSTLLNYCDIGPDLVQYLVEINPLKIGRVSPGTHIPIVAKEPGPPDYYLVLAWNFAPFFIERYQSYLDAGGHFIVPMPSVEIIGAERTPR